MSASAHSSEGPALVAVSDGQRRRVLGLVLVLSVLIALWRLGSTGLMDETPPLFAAAGRAMADTGDWLTRVKARGTTNAACVLAGAFNALPGREGWDPLGNWAARLPSGWRPWP